MVEISGQFSDAGAQRIIRSTIRTENLQSQESPTQGVNFTPNRFPFLAKLQSKNGAKYGWKKVGFKSDSEDLETVEDYGKATYDDDFHAREINGSTECVVGEIVLLIPTAKHFLFEYQRTYRATLNGSTAQILDWDDYEVSVTVRGDSIEDGTGVYITHINGGWEVISSTSCPSGEDE